MHAKPDLRVLLEWMIAGSGSVITDVMRLEKSNMPNKHSVIRFSLSQSIVALTMIGAVLALLVSVGVWSCFIACFAAILICGIYLRYLSGWSSFSSKKKLAACLFVSLCLAIVSITAAAFWIQPAVQSNRLTAIYNSRFANSDLTISVVQTKLLCVTISGNLNSESDFDRLRSDVLRRFSGSRFTYLKWNVTTDSGVEFRGADHELFPNRRDGESAA